MFIFQDICIGTIADQLSVETTIPSQPMRQHKHSQPSGVASISKQTPAQAASKHQFVNKHNGRQARATWALLGAPRRTVPRLTIALLGAMAERVRA